MILVVVLGVVGLIAITIGTVRIVSKQTLASAPASVAPAPMPAAEGGMPASVPLAPNALLIREILRSVMPAIVSVAMLIPSSVVVLSKDRPPDHQRWATATISSIVTYWLT
jgi:hypothetical protein